MMTTEDIDPRNSSAHRYVSTAQVAQALGVSVTTVKRWVDEEILPAHRTVGGHRKLLMADVLRLVREGNLPQADLTRLLPKQITIAAEPKEIYHELLQAMRVVDVDHIRNILHSGYQSGVPIETLADRVIGPAMAQVGYDWSIGKIDVMHEHRITQACISAMYELRSFLRLNAEKDRPIAVGGAPENDHSVLPTLLAKLTLLDAGWDAINLGPHTPMAGFESALKHLQPQLIWFSVTHIQDMEKFGNEYRRFYAMCQQKGVSVSLGGQGMTDAIRMQLPYTTFGDGLTQLGAFARSLHRRPVRPKRGRPPGSTTKD
jgi:MerR family transcriptional regulator, light-induced transcriptional regulator